MWFASVAVVGRFLILTDKGIVLRAYKSRGVSSFSFFLYAFSVQFYFVFMVFI